MKRKHTIVFYVSGHGFGHASRQIEIINAITTMYPDIGVIVRTAVPRWLFDRSASSPITVHTEETDTGVVQIDSLRVDPSASIKLAWEFHRTLEDRAKREALLLERYGATLVVGDIPPVAFTSAALARIPSVAVGNFTWDWIYRKYQAQLHLGPELLHTIREAYASAETAWQLPLTGADSFSVFSNITRAPFVARHARHSPADTRKALSLPSDRPLILVSFGRYGLQAVNWSAVTQAGNLGVILTRDPIDPGPTLPTIESHPGLYTVDIPALATQGFDYADLVAAADIVLTKPGYGIIAECVANRTALMYTSRGDFAEYEILVNAMPQLLRCTYLPQEDLFAGRWSEAAKNVLKQPPVLQVRTDGAQIIAKDLAQRASAGPKNL